MNYKLLNNIINYIESNIQEDLDYKKIASKFGMNEFIMQRVFSVIMGITLSDYVRERRLSKAYEEILNTDKRIIDIAFDCGYESSIAFSRAFKKTFGISPSDIRKEQPQKYNIYPKAIFGEKSYSNEIIEYKIDSFDKVELYGLQISALTEEDLDYKIQVLYEDIKKSGLYEQFNANQRYGYTYFSNGVYYYFVGSPEKNEKLFKLVIPKNDYVVFEVGNLKQKSINHVIEFAEKVFNESWFSSDLKIYPILEKYVQNNCYVFLPIM